MKTLSLIELLRLSRIELCDQLATLTNAFPDIPEGSEDHAVARHNLRLLRTALSLRPAGPP
ncbi:MAG: hypothetical protein A4S14_14705 [Proteobacteria bacterium SG_bin9]|nr:MAG: hypothetical protein A4S14_14705 [Proteobacteria bacterium SG_bin9]